MPSRLSVCTVIIVAISTLILTSCPPPVPVNQPPRILGDMRVYTVVNSDVVLSADAVDPDGDDMEIVWSLPDGTLIESETFGISIDQAGIFEFALQVSDPYHVVYRQALVVVTDSGIQDHPMINEISRYGDYLETISGGGVESYVVEIFHPGNQAVDFSGWSLQVTNDYYSGREVETIDLTPFGIVQPGQFLVIGGPDTARYLMVESDQLIIVPENLSIYSYGSGIALLDGADQGVDFVALTTDAIAPPDGTAWDTSAGTVSGYTGSSVIRSVSTVDTDSAADWDNTFCSIGFPNDAEIGIDLKVVLR